MTDLYLLATVRMKELERRLGPAPWESEPALSRGRMVLARWFLAAAERLWPEARREVMEGVR